MAKQVRIRRDSATNLNAVTPASSELGHDTTNNRIVVGDGLTSGGIPLTNFRDHLNNTFVAANAGGTGNAITLTLTKAPSSYTTYMRVIFKASANNTGATTIDINSLGSKNIQKMSSGSLAALASGDIISGGLYEIMYDGTQFQLLTLTNAGITAVSQGNLNTSTGTVSANHDFVLLPGGTYGFAPEIRSTSSTRYPIAWISKATSETTFGQSYFLGARGTAAWGIRELDSGGTDVYTIASIGTAESTAELRQRYITSSPPFDLGDGDAGGFFFALLDQNGDIKAHYAADVPPWGYNGPTNIRADFIDNRTGKKYRKVMIERTFEEIMDGASINYQYEEITHKIKNADMDLIPHPFGTVPQGHTVVLLDTVDDRIRKMIDYQNSGGDLMEQIKGGYIKVDNDQLVRKGPKNIKICRMKYKYGGKK